MSIETANGSQSMNEITLSNEFKRHYYEKFAACNELKVMPA